MTSSIEQAEELVQDTFVVVLTKPPKFYNDRALLSWLTRVMRNLHANNQRKAHHSQ